MCSHLGDRAPAKRERDVLLEKDGDRRTTLDDNEGPVGPEPDPFDPPACNALAADRVWAMLDLGRAEREADAPTSRSAYERLRAAAGDNFVSWRWSVEVERKRWFMSIFSWLPTTSATTTYSPRPHRTSQAQNMTHNHQDVSHHSPARAMVQ